MRTKFIVIEPHYTDLDTHCFFDISNGRCRASIEIYADMSMLSGVVAALEAPELDHPWPEHPTDQGRILLGLFLSVTKSDTYRVLHASVIESGVCNADIHIQLNEEESADLAKELRAWIEKPIYQFIWKKFGWEG